MSKLPLSFPFFLSRAAQSPGPDLGLGSSAPMRSRRERFCITRQKRKWEEGSSWSVLGDQSVRDGETQRAREGKDRAGNCSCRASRLRSKPCLAGDGATPRASAPRSFKSPFTSVCWFTSSGWQGPPGSWSAGRGALRPRGSWLTWRRSGPAEPLRGTFHAARACYSQTDLRFGVFHENRRGKSAGPNRPRGRF